MEERKVKAYAKINLGLDVVGKLENGYHLLRTIMQQIDLYDTITLSKTENCGEIMISSDSGEVPADESNLAYRAAKRMMEQFPIKEGVSIHLEKRIPVAAGMAGGSSDAAGVMLGMNQLFSLGATNEQLQEIGVKIGADVPFCIKGGTALAEGIGEKMTTIDKVPKMHIVVAKPPIMVSTKEVFENLAIHELKHPDTQALLEAFAQDDLDKAIANIGNVLETVTVKKYPIIEELKSAMKTLGAAGAFMSGSGPTVFGIFKEEKAAKEAELKLKEQYPAVFVQMCGLVEKGKGSEND